MQHLRPMGRRPSLAQDNDNTSGLESIILLLLGLFFNDWDNYPQVAQNLQKFYAKTPD